MTRADMPDAAFYCVANARHFLGAVALLNSLRLAGHAEPLFVLDAGLERAQRELLAPHATIVPAPGDRPPTLVKWAAPLAHPARVMVLIDADIVVTRSLAPVLEAAREHVVAFVDAVPDRFHPAWGEAFGLGRPRRELYLNAGLIALPHGLGTEVLELVKAAQGMLDVAATRLGGGRPGDPFFFPDQNVWNGVLRTRVPESRIVRIDYRLAPHAPFRGLALVDEKTLECRYADGVQPFLLHHISAKPWLRRLRPNPYSRLLPRLLLADDVALSVPPDLVPLRFRHGTRAWIERRRSDVLALVWSQRGRLGIRRRLAARRAAA